MYRYMIMIDRDDFYGRISPNFGNWGDVVYALQDYRRRYPQGFNKFIIMRAENDAALQLAWERITEEGDDLESVILDPRLCLDTLQTNVIPGVNEHFGKMEQEQSKRLASLMTKQPQEQPYTPTFPEQDTPDRKRWEFARAMVRKGVFSEFPAETEREVAD